MVWLNQPLLVNLTPKKTLLVKGFTKDIELTQIHAPCFSFHWILDFSQILFPKKEKELCYLLFWVIMIFVEKSKLKWERLPIKLTEYVLVHFGCINISIQFGFVYFKIQNQIPYCSIYPVQWPILLFFGFPYSRLIHACIWRKLQTNKKCVVIFNSCGYAW